jgi:hypothetical protein
VSSTILYLAIVAIWAGILVPRWLRRDPHRETVVPSSQVSPGQGEPADGPNAVGPPGVPGLSVSASVIAGDAGLAGHPASPQGAGAPAGPGAGRVPRVSRADERGGDVMAARRGGGVMAARRRLFGVLVLLFAVAMVIAVSGLADWWVVVPPAGMLAGFMMLLREAARADAERNARIARRGGAAGSAHRSAAGAGRGAGAASPHAPAAGDSGEQASAHVIDLTAHVSDEPYDQDADAKLRAVGD